MQATLQSNPNQPEVQAAFIFVQAIMQSAVHHEELTEGMVSYFFRSETYLRQLVQHLYTIGITDIWKDKPLDLYENVYERFYIVHCPQDVQDRIDRYVQNIFNASAISSQISIWQAGYLAHQANERTITEGMHLYHFDSNDNMQKFTRTLSNSGINHPLHIEESPPSTLFSIKYTAGDMARLEHFRKNMSFLQA